MSRVAVQSGSGLLGVLSVFLLGAWVAVRTLALQGAARLMVWIAFALLGLLAGGLLALYLARRAREKAQQDASAGAHEEIDALFASARRALSSSGVAGESRIPRLPLLLVLGPDGSAKTTVVLRSGLEPELLAGEVHRGETVVPTGVANVWLGHGTVLVEAGGGVLNDTARWKRLIRHIQPSRLGAAIRRGRQAPRAAIVCFACDEFLRPGAAESVQAHARRMRGRLVELAHELGIRLPVYVLFTRADRLPYFTDFVRSFTREESAETLGVTLPAEPAAAGSWAERESSRISAAFRSLFRGLAAHRIHVLPRETTEDVRSGAYEFPREFRKISDLATQFLVDLCRPSQLSVSPYLRGFYFTGVRPIVVHDAAAAAIPAAAAHGVAPDATAVFNPRLLAQAGAPAQASGGRRVPDWTFLKRVFPEIILADDSALRATGGGSRLNLLRRGILGAAAGLLLFFSFGFTVSYFRNDGLKEQALAAARGLEGIDVVSIGDGITAAVPALERLDTLRELIHRLRVHEAEGAPFWSRWGLYTGDDLLAHLRSVYFARFDPLLWTRTGGALRGYLAALPERPNETSDYNRTYDALKAYLITTRHPDQSTEDFLVPVLEDHWSGQREQDPVLADLVRRQFAFLSAELERGPNPLRDDASDELVQQARQFLNSYGDENTFYQTLRAEAARVGSPVSYTSQAVRSTYTVPAEFTAPGWQEAKRRLSEVSTLFECEDWVVGVCPVPEGEQQRLADLIGARYVADYLAAWRRFLISSSVTPFQSPNEAVVRLQLLAEPTSPVLQLLNTVARHTSVDTVEVAPAFQPVFAVTGTTPEQRMFSDGYAPYMAALMGLRSAVEGVTRAVSGPERAGAATQADNAASQVEAALGVLAGGFRYDGKADSAAAATQRLLRQPPDYVKRLTSGFPLAELNGEAASFCTSVAPVLRLYPFASGGGAEANMEQLQAVFAPQAGALAQLENNLQSRGVIVPQGTGYRSAGNPAFRPGDAYMTMLNRLVAFSRGIYPGGPDPRATATLQFELGGTIEAVTVTLDGLPQRVTPTDQRFVLLTWTPAGPRAARLTVTSGGQERQVAQGQGLWAAFQLFRASQWQSRDDGYQVTWAIPGEQAGVRAVVRMNGGVPPIFNPAYLGGLGCRPRIR